jgi:hypothetical protein
MVASSDRTARALGLATLAGLVLLFCGPARGAEPPVLNQRVSVGVAGLWSHATGGVDLDLLLAERLRWEALRRPDVRLRVLADARFAFDLVGKPRLTATWSALEWGRVRRLGVEIETPAMTLQLGRHPVHRGGFRLVDGVQLITRPKPHWEVGLWGGLAPDAVSTMPALRFGGGPLAALTLSWLQVSLAGEILGTPAGLDRLGALIQGRLSLDPHLELHARADLQVPDGRGGGALVDAAVFLRGRPHRSLDLELLYDAYSSVRYLRSVDRDPAARRFALRAEALGLTEGVPQELNDPTIHHLVGFSGRWRPGLDAARLRPTLGLDLRYRHHAEPARRFARASLRGGLLGIGDRLDLLLDGGVLMVDRRPRGELGLSALLELGRQRLVALDGSARLSLLPGDEGGVAPAWYGDLFVDVLTPFGLVLAAGIYGEGLSVPQGWDVAVGGLARVTWRMRLRRKG